jgi:CelD/BcsL family acetyltransferase involved in cellulose biosynthesis
LPGLVQNLQNTLRGAWRHLFGQDSDHCPDPIESAGLRARCDEHWPTDPAFAAAWDRFHASVPTATAFQTNAWQRAVCETLCRPGRLRLLSIWQDANLAALFPMSIRDDGLLESLGPAVSDYLDPLIAPELESQVWSVFLKLFTRLRSGKRRAVTLHNIRDAAPCRTILRELAPTEGFSYEDKPIEHPPVITLPKTWDDYLASLDPHERKETRRKLNKVQTKTQSRVVRCSSNPAEIARTLTHAFALMEQAPGEKGQAIRSTIRPLLEKAAPALIQSGHLWLTTLYLNDQHAAVTLQFPSQAGPQLYNCGFDPTKKEYSPGVVLTSMIIQDAIQTGAKEFDLLRGQEPYKYKLAAKDRPLWMISLNKL